jgi:hypothetical protein
LAPSPLERDLERLEAELKKLESEYNMFFAGRLPRPPWETRGQVEAMVKHYDRAHIQSYADRFRFWALQSRFQTFVDLWDRGLRAREEGRPGPFAAPASSAPEPQRGPSDRILLVASFVDPMQDLDKLRDLYDAVADARREVGDVAVPFHRFAELVRAQVNKLKSEGGREVAFRVALKDGKVNFTARALKGRPAVD